MAAAAKGLVAIYVDCTKDGAHQDLMTKYAVRGFPTVIFTDPEGKQVGQMTDRSPAGLKAQIEQVIQRHKRAGFPEGTLDEAAAAAREGTKLLAVLFVEEGDSDGLTAMTAAVYGDAALEQLRGRFQWVKRPLKEAKKATPEAKSFKASKSPTLVLIDPRGEGELPKQILGTATSGKGLKAVLEKALDKAEKAEAGEKKE